MDFAPYVLVGQDRKAWRALPNEACRAFIQLVLHSTSDRAHPFWSVRPLTISHLASLWPGRRPESINQRDDRDRALRFAIEDELLSRLKSRLPGAETPSLSSVSDHNHAQSIWKFNKHGGCTLCGKVLRELKEGKVVVDNGIASLVESALEKGNTADLGTLVPCLLSELVANGATTRYLHQITKTFVLHGDEQNPTFLDRVHTLLHPGTASSEKPKPRRLGWILGYTASQVPVSVPSTSIDGVYVDKIGNGELAIILDDVPSLASDEERAAQKVRSESETWLGYIRLAAPRRELRVSGDIHIVSESHPVPAHRAFWSAQNAKLGLAAFIESRGKYAPEDQVRIDASVAWAGLALDVWPESPIRAVGLVWMGLEALFETPLKGQAIYPYLNRLPIELGYEIARHHQRLRAITHKRADCADKELWVWKLLDVKQASAMREWLEQLVDVVKKVASPAEEALLIRANEVLNLFDHKCRRDFYPQVYRDLCLVYAVRNGMAHSGHFEMEISLAHYLFNLGLEILKAAISEVISTYKGIHGDRQLSLKDVWSASGERLEGEPTMLVENTEEQIA